MKNKPMDDEAARELFNLSGDYEIALHNFMESKGYKWDRSEYRYVDDGSLESEWADKENDYRKENVK